MSNMTTSKTHDAEKITRVQELLHQETERVEDLKALLATAEQHVEQLKQELAGYQMAATFTPTPINDCPPEILSMIFKLSMPLDDIIHHTGRLLLVCKRWHNLIVNDPSMWNCVSIVAPNQWDMSSWAYSTRSYLELCVERSRASCLNIQLDFSSLQTTQRQLMKRLHVGFFHLSSDAEKEEDSNLLYDWLNGLDYYSLEDGRCSTTTKDCLPDHAIRLLRVLMVPEVMRRWESLVLTFPPTTDLAEEIWEVLAPYIVNLSYLHLIGSSWDHLLQIYGFAGLATSLSIPRWSIPRIKDLEIESLIGWDRYLSFNPSSLHRLTVKMSSKKEFFSEIARFSELRTLRLVCIPSYKDLIPSRLISLPKLQELILSGFYDRLSVKWEVPSLKRLHVDSKRRDYLQPAMPIVQPSEVHWEVTTESYHRWEILQLAGETIRGFLLVYTSTGHFSVTSFLKDTLLKVLKELSTERVLPPRWRTVSFHDTYGGMETMDIDNIVCT